MCESKKFSVPGCVRNTAPFPVHIPKAVGGWRLDDAVGMHPLIQGEQQNRALYPSVPQMHTEAQGQVIRHSAQGATQLWEEKPLEG